MAIPQLNANAGPVTLSKQAQSFSDLASRGITSFTIADGKGALQALKNGTTGPASGMPSGLGGAVSAREFDQIMRNLGATLGQTDRIRQGFDSNDDGSITNDEILRGLADLGKKTDSPDAQLLLSLMDRSGNNDGVVDQYEFTGVETSLVFAEKK